MKNENIMKHITNCSEIQMLVDDYLEGMISHEDRQVMEEHLKGCQSCRNYLEDTVLILEKAALMASEDEKEGHLLAKTKQQQMWSQIEAKINQKLPLKDSHVYNMNGFEDEYYTPDNSTDGVKHIPAQKPGVWHNMRYYFSGLAAVLILAFVIYGVNRYMNSRDTGLDLSSNIVEISGGPKWMVNYQR